MFQSVPQLPDSPIFLDFSICFSIFQLFSPTNSIQEHHCRLQDNLPMYSSFRFLRVSKGVFDAMKKLMFQSIHFQPLALHFSFLAGSPNQYRAEAQLEGPVGPKFQSCFLLRFSVVQSRQEIPTFSTPKDFSLLYSESTSELQVQ